jgi:tetratricopeptide (TPR) repeat protein
MAIASVFRGLCLTAGLVAFIQVGTADYYTLIIEGNVVMPDGSPPPKTVGIERVCSDVQASAPGPLVDKKGHYTWKMDLDPENTRVCFLRATMPGFTSTRFDLDKIKLNDFQQNKLLKVDDLILQPRDTGESNKTVMIPEDEAPGKARAQYKAAIKAMDAQNGDEAIKQLQLAIKAVPKFADAWNILGAVYEQRGMLMEAKDALLHAIDINPKLASPYLRLARISNKLGDWDAAAKNEDALLKIETRFYPEIYLHQGITRFELKNLTGAEESLKTAQSLDAAHRLYRVEYVLGLIALAKGDLNGAKEHIANYMKSDPTTPDIEKIQVQLDTLGQPDSSKLSIPLERP